MFCISIFNRAKPSSIEFKMEENSTTAGTFPLPMYILSALNGIITVLN